MVSDFQRLKLTHLFHFLDTDSSATLEKEDFIEIAEIIADKRGFKPVSNEYKSLVIKAEKLFQHFAQEISTDQPSITLNEWLAFFDSEVINREDDLMLDEYIELILSYVFGFTDANHDGYISREEYQDLFSVFDIESAHAEMAFRNIDANQDGRLSRYELKDAIEVYLTSDEEQDLKNWIFGDWTSSTN